MRNLDNELDLIRLNAFISVLKADKDLYERRIPLKKEKGLNTDLEEVILNRTIAQLEFLGVKNDD